MAAFTLSRRTAKQSRRSGVRWKKGSAAHLLRRTFTILHTPHWHSACTCACLCARGSNACVHACVSLDPIHVHVLGARICVAWPDVCSWQGGE